MADSDRGRDPQATDGPNKSDPESATPDRQGSPAADPEGPRPGIQEGDGATQISGPEAEPPERSTVASGGGAASPDGATAISDRADPGDAPTVISNEAADAPTVISDAPEADPDARTQLEGAIANAISGASGGGLRAGQVLGGRYEILGLLGEGGFGAVYRAHDRTLQREIALKTIHPHLVSNAHLYERFKREILLSSKITHKHVVRVHDLVEFGELKCISMQFVEGRDLASLLRQEGQLSSERALPIARQIASALQAAHDSGVVHRDLKPQNVLLDKQGNAYIADFGIARSLEGGATMTETGALVGTMAYMSPEQARGEVPDHRADIYALGLILYEMVTGQLPFQAENALSVLMKRVHEDVPKVETKVGGVPPWLARVVARATARELDDRYASIADLLADLETEQAARVAPKLPWRKLALGGAFAALLLIIAVLAWRGGAAAPDEGDSGPVEIRAELALVPFVNATQDAEFAWIEDGLPDLLGTDLEQSRALRLVPTARSRRAIQSLALNRDANGFAEQDLARLAQVLGVDRLLTGRLYKVGDSYKLTAYIQQAGGGAVVAGTPISLDASGDEALFRLVELLGERLKRRLGLSRRRRASDEWSTDSLIALRMFSEAESAIRDGSDLDAAAQLRGALAQDPTFALARIRLAEVYERLGQLPEAVDAAGRAAADLGDGNALEAVQVEAVRARLAGDADRAERAYRRWAELAPNRAETHLGLAELLEGQGRFEEALESIRRAAELDPSNLSVGLAHGRMLARSGAVAEAIPIFQDLQNRQSAANNIEGMATVQHAMGRTYDLLGRSDLALQSFSEALRLREQRGDLDGQGDTLSSLAIVNMNAGDVDAAIDYQRRAIAAFEQVGAPATIGSAWSNLGDIYDAAGQTDDAVQAYGRAIDLLRDLPNSPELLRAQGNLGYIRTVQGDYQAAALLLDQVLTRRREKSDAVGLLYALSDAGIVDELTGQYDRAAGRYAEALELARRTAQDAAVVAMSINLANVHRELGDFAQAQREQSEAADLVARIDVPAYRCDLAVGRGALRLQVGDVEGARAALAEATAIAEQIESPSCAAASQVWTGWALLQADPAGARRTFDAALGDADSLEFWMRQFADVGRATARANRSELEGIVAETERQGALPMAARAAVAAAQAHFRSSPRATATLESIAVAERLSGRTQQAELMLQTALLRLRSEPDPSVAGPVAQSAVALLGRMLSGLSQSDRAFLLDRPTVEGLVGVLRSVDLGEARAGIDDSMQRLLEPDRPGNSDSS